MEREACVCDHGFERSDLCMCGNNNNNNIGILIQVKNKINEEEATPPLRSREVFIVGFPPTRPSPLNTFEL